MGKLVIYIILLILIIVLILFGGMSIMTNQIGKDIKSTWGIGEERSLFLNNINFNDGSYALYVKHQDFGEFIVVDEKILRANKKNLKVKVSLLNYLPGEGDRSYGVKLFKDGEVVKSEHGGAFKTFEIGSLQENSLAVKEHRYYGPKIEIQEKIDALHSSNNTYITLQPKFTREGKEFYFRVLLPTVALPVKREKENYRALESVNGIDIQEWQSTHENAFIEKVSHQIEQRIREKASGITDFDVSIMGVPDFDTYVLNDTQGKMLRDKDNRILYVDYRFYQFDVTISANEELATTLMSLDYSDCVDEEYRNKAGVIESIKKVIEQSTTPDLSLEDGEVFLKFYTDSAIQRGSLSEWEYPLTWLEVDKE